MVPVISEQKWLEWCVDNQLPTKTARFVLDTCYYGLGLRTRPGTILITDSEIIHKSYSWQDTRWAIFEPSVCITIPLSQVREIKQVTLGIFAKLLHAMPESIFEVTTQDEDKHAFVLQRDSNDFVQAVHSLGFKTS